MAKLKNTTAAATAMMASQGMGESVRWASRMALSMGDPLLGWCRDDFDGIGADHGDDLDARAGGQGFVGGDGLVLDRAVLQVQMDLAGAGAAAGDGQVDGTVLADGPLDADGPFRLEGVEGADQPADQEEGA